MNPEDLQPLPASEWKAKLQLVHVEEPKMGGSGRNEFITLTFRLVGTKFYILDHLSCTPQHIWKAAQRANALTTAGHLKEMKAQMDMTPTQLYEHFKRMLDHTCQATLSLVPGSLDYRAHWQIRDLRKSYNRKKWNGHEDRRPSMGRM